MRIHLDTQQERPRVKCDCVFAPWHASGPSCVWCPSITGNLALCELIKVESICSNPIQLTPELLLTHPATRAKLPSPLRPMTRDNTPVLFRIGWFAAALWWWWWYWSNEIICLLTDLIRFDVHVHSYSSVNKDRQRRTHPQPSVMLKKSCAPRLYFGYFCIFASKRHIWDPKQ